jgi:hypothetical protein
MIVRSKIFVLLATAAGIAILSTGLTFGEGNENRNVPLHLVAFGKNVAESSAVIVGARMMIPVGDRRGMLESAQALFSGLGATALYDPYFRHLTIGIAGTQMEFLGNSAIAMLNGAPYRLDAPALQRGDVYYIPIRSFARAFGISLTWQRASNIVALGGAPRAASSIAAADPSLDTPAPSAAPELPHARSIPESLITVPTVQPATPPPPAAVRYASVGGQVQAHASLTGSPQAVAEVFDKGSLGAVLGAYYATQGARSNLYAGIGAPREGHIYATAGVATFSTINGSVGGFDYGVTKLPDINLPASGYGSVQYVPTTRMLLYRAGLMVAPQASRLLIGFGISGERISGENVSNVIYTGSVAEYLDVGVRF